MPLTPKRYLHYWSVRFSCAHHACGLLANATVVHVMDVAALVESSDVIIAGRVTSIAEQGTTSINIPGRSIRGKKLVAVLSTDEILKGNIETPNLSFEFAMPDAPAGIQGIPAAQYGIFFLRRESSNYTVVDPVFPFLPAVPDGRSSAGLPLDRVIARLGEVLTYGGSTEFEILTALDALARIPGKFASQTLQQALETSSGDLQLRTASKLVARNDTSGLDLVENALTHPAGRSNDLLLNLAGSLGGLKDPRAIPALKRLLETHDQHIIKGAAIALRQSGSAEALEPLSRLLTNSDEQVRYYAVVGMGEITGQDEWTPAFDEFRDHEAKYLTYWRDWATSNLPRDARK